MKLSLIVAMSRNGVIGKDGGLPWGRIPEDMRLFRELTDGDCVIVGRKTWAGMNALPGRTVVVLSQSLPPDAKGRGRVNVSNSHYAAVGRAMNMDFSHAWVAGGAQTYAAFQADYTSAHVTLIDRDYDGDTVFPFPILDSPDWRPLAEPRELAPGVVYHHMGRVSKP